MADPTRAGEAQPEVVRRHTAPADRRAELFDQLRQRAEDLARTAEFSAAVHAKMPAHLLNPPDHAERDRRLAAAERAAAEAYRAHRVPSEEVRAAIRRAGDTGGAL
jgi:hypothetical protein